MEKKLVNLTPHEIKIVGEDGDVEGLPEPQSNTVYIVSTLVAQAVPHRDDIIAPDTSPQGVVRDSEGKIIGVKRFQRW